MDSKDSRAQPWNFKFSISRCNISYAFELVKGTDKIS